MFPNQVSTLIPIFERAIGMKYMPLLPAVLILLCTGYASAQNIPQGTITRSLATASNGDLYAGTDRGVFRSTDQGASWTGLNSGMVDTSIHALGIFRAGGSQEYIYAGTENGVYRSAMQITGVRSNEANVPVAFQLLQNYPNPFNPSTVIEFVLPRHEHVMLKIFNVLGQVVSILADDELSVGRHSVRWDASGVSSGVYFYRLQSADFTETKKLVVMR
jgi:hypothetical protein